MKAKFNRIMLKLSGEGLSAERGFGIDSPTVERLAREIAEISRLGVQVCLVVGGGNFFRGAKNACKDMDRSVADQIGMMATVINALALKSALEACGQKAKVFSGLSVPSVCDDYRFDKAQCSLDDGNVTIFAGGTGNPYFTTDSGAALRAVEMHCDVLMKATQVDGVYDSDPRSNSKAKRFEQISYSEVIEKQLKVMDMTAVAMLQDNNIPIMIFKQSGDNPIINAVCGKGKYSIIK
jgi:uridylate kinase